MHSTETCSHTHTHKHTCKHARTCVHSLSHTYMHAHTHACAARTHACNLCGSGLSREHRSAEPLRQSASVCRTSAPVCIGHCAHSQRSNRRRAMCACARLLAGHPWSRGCSSVCAMCACASKQAVRASVIDSLAEASHQAGMGGAVQQSKWLDVKVRRPVLLVP